MTAANVLRAALSHMEQRAATYDKPDGERSMGATVEAFRAVTGVCMTEEQGWLFMALLKSVRSQQGAYRADSYEDGAAYFALAGEAACRDRSGGWGTASIRAAALTPEWPENDDRMDIIGQNGNDGAAYGELDRLQAAADFADDVPVVAKEPQRARHQCLSCGLGHATHECGAGL